MTNDIDLGIGIGTDLGPAEMSLKKIKCDNLADLEGVGIREGISPETLAAELGYGGKLELGALLNYIRFYQRHTVESALEMGKGLVLLKAITPHGLFIESIQNMGFSQRSAQRFMKAAIRVTQNGGLALLAKQAKNVSAFLEMVTLEDDDIQNILALDDLDRMSATQLRNLARSLRADKDTLQTRLNTSEARFDRLSGEGIECGLSKETVVARSYCMGAAETASKKLDGLAAYFTQDIQSGTEEARLRMEQAWVTAHVIAARALGLIERMKEQAPFELPPRIMGQHILTPEEAKMWARDAVLIENKEHADRVHLEGSEKRGRGRPKKEPRKG
jgi:hypothetical protein